MLWVFIRPVPEVSLLIQFSRLCNQLLAEFSGNQLATFHRYFTHIEKVHVTFAAEKHFVMKLRVFSLRQFLRSGFDIG